MFIMVSAVKGFCSINILCAGSRGALGACTRLADSRLYLRGVVLDTKEGSGLQDFVAERQYRLSSLSAVGLINDSGSHVGSKSPAHMHL
jgi:hypothetical protein